MRWLPIPLLLAAAFAACGPCLAQQSRGAATATVPIDITETGDTAGTPQAAPPRSAFGKVIAVMIASLRQQAHARGHPAAPVRTTAAGTPLGIEAGAAFRPSLASPVDSVTTQATPPMAPPVAPPRLPTGPLPPGAFAVRQAAQVGPG